MECFNFINSCKPLVFHSCKLHIHPQLWAKEILQGSCLSATDQRFKAVVVYRPDTPFGACAMASRRKARILRKFIERYLVEFADLRSRSNERTLCIGNCRKWDWLAFVFSQEQLNHRYVKRLSKSWYFDLPRMLEPQDALRMTHELYCL